MTIFILIGEVILVILSVDLVSGLVHWIEDTFWMEETPVLGRWIVKPNFIIATEVRSHETLGYRALGTCWRRALSS